MFGKMAIGGFLKNGGERYWVGRWCFVDIKKVVGRDVRRRPAKPGGRELADLGLWGAGMKRMVAGGIGRPSRKRWFWMLKKYAPRVFASWKPKLQKKHLAIDGLAAAAAECKREILAGWRRKRMC